MNWFLLRNSLLVAGLATLEAASFGFVAAVWVAGLPARWRGVFLGLAGIALALPPFLVTNCWLHFLGHNGVWRGWLPIPIISLGGAVWILGLLTWPISTLAVCGAWRRLDASQLDSDPAVAGWALLRGVLVPLAWPALFQAGVVTFVLALNNFAVPAILQVKVFPAEMWVLFNTSFDTLGALRLSWPLVLGPLLLLLALSRGDIPWPNFQGPVPPSLFRRQLGHIWFGCCGIAASLLGLLSVGLPVWQLISARRTWVEMPGALAASQAAVWNSLGFAGIAATLIVALSLAVVTYLRGHAAAARRKGGTPGSPGSRSTTGLPPEGDVPDRGSWRNSICSAGRALLHARPWLAPVQVVGWLLWLPFLVPGVLLGIGLIILFNRPWSWIFYQSSGIVVLAFVVRYLAMGWNGIARGLAGVDPDLTDAARLEGATRWQMLRHVYLPQIAAPAAAAWYVVFLLCLWDVESMILIVPPGGETLALRVFNLLHYGHNAQVNALCVALLALALAPLLLWCAGRFLARAWPRVAWLGVACALMLAGCGPPLASNESPIKSRFFNRVRVIGSRGVGLGQLNKPRSVAVDLLDNVYAVDMTGRVQKFSSNGVFLLSWQMPQTDLGKPKGMCRDRDGNIFVIEPHYQRVNLFSPLGQLLAQWGQRGTNVGEFMLPRAMAVDSRNVALVSEYGPVERVQRFQLAARGAAATNRPSSSEPAVFLGGFGKPGNGPGEFNRPEGLCVDGQDRLYVADSCNHRIQVFSSDGSFLRAYGKPGRGRGELSYPYDICVDSAGRQYVCEFGNSRIQVFDAHDQSLEIIGGPGAGPGQFNDPWGVALDSEGNLYVADSQNHRVQKLIRGP